MNIRYLIYRNLRKNLQNYYLYVFALIFSVALYFAFVTLQYDPVMDDMKESIRGLAAIKSGSVFLVVIVGVFLLYANNLFIKRRGKEIGLFQLIGMTKGKIFRILSVENLLLYVSSLMIGIFLGFSISKLIVMILIKMTGIETIATLNFSTKAFIQTIIIFAMIYLFIMLMNFITIKRQSILSLFQATSTTEYKVKKLSLFTIISGILGIGLVIFGYYMSTKLFGGDFPGYKLFIAMLTILSSVIVGTYFFYKGSISFIFHLIRKKKDGYLTLTNVLSLSSIMFRMKSNAFLLTVITIVSTLAMSLLSLTYISYYSAEKTAKEAVPNHFTLFADEEVDKFTSALEANKISYTTTTIDNVQIFTDMTGALVPGTYEHLDIGEDPRMITRVISDQSIKDITVKENEIVLTEPHDILEQMLSFKNNGTIELIGQKNIVELEFIGMEEKSILPLRLTDGFPIAIVHDQVIQDLANNLDESMQDEFSTYIGIDINHSRHVAEANDIFHELQLNQWEGKWTGYESQLEVNNIQKQGMGLTMFIVGFLGLTFLIVSGCILYFKQMDESEMEKSDYTILRKLGFTNDDLLKGIRIKQTINFGIPLILGLVHSYFGVKSGWFIFGSEMWTPMLIVMIVYTALYSIFGLLSIQYYKQVIKNAL